MFPFSSVPYRNLIVSELVQKLIFKNAEIIKKCASPIYFGIITLSL